MNNMTSQYKVMCGSECCISSKSINSSLLSWPDYCLKQLKDKSHNAQNISSGEISRSILETYKNSVQHHSCNIFNTTADMIMEKCLPVLLNIMFYHTGNVCYVVVISDQVLYY